ncbi:MAG TPA: DUF2726 domain-containing protein [Nitrospiraceae bacterium]|nr:DUF2726 domain-containing protein [Nitrospiraceae bacterium]
MLIEPMIPIVIAAVVLLTLLGVWVVKIGRKSHTEVTATQAHSIPAGITLSSQPLLTRAEASVYNLLRLAARDHYLVFSQIPIWCVVEISAADQKVRQAFLQQIALKRVDFALVHPGTLTVAKVVELEEGTEPSAQRQARNRLIDEILKTAGIEVVRLAPQSSSSVPDIAVLLDLDPIEP